jgi:hypothetical protein
METTTNSVPALPSHQCFVSGLAWFDVIVFDPTSLLVLHARRERTVRATSPQNLALVCGCDVTV